MTITEFLLARIAEDEEVAKRAAHLKVAGPLHKWHPNSAFLTSVDMLDRAERVHIARHHPARVLAECEAKRRIVEREDRRLRERWRERSDEHHMTFEEWFQPPFGVTLRDLASIYADHPDYDPSWRVS